MIVTEAQIISGLIIKATGQKSDNSCAILGRVLHQFPAINAASPEVGGFAGWEGIIQVSGNAVATVNLMTGVGSNYAGSPDLSKLRGVDWEGVAVTARPLLRAVMVENLGDSLLTIFSDANGIISNVKLEPFCTLHLSGRSNAVPASVPQIWRFSRVGTLLQPVRITVLLEASD